MLETPLLLAPIAGYCDLAFRQVARSCGGVGMASTDLLCPEGLLRETYKSMQLSRTAAGDWPLSMQLYGGEADKLCEAARWAMDHGATSIDINMGCPVDKITKRDGGSKLLCDPDRTVKMVERVRSVVTDRPLTAKMRLGWDDTCIVAPELARRLEESGIDLVTVHGRTTEMRFSGQARLDGIAEVVAAVKKIPVIGNGDIHCSADARKMLVHTKCNGLMIGRAALGKPWLLAEIWHELTTDTAYVQPTLEAKVDMIRRHFWGQVENRSARAAVVDFRKRISWYAKHLQPCPEFKEEIRLLKGPEEFDEICQRFLVWRAEGRSAEKNSRNVVIV